MPKEIDWVTSRKKPTEKLAVRALALLDQACNKRPKLDDELPAKLSSRS